jgi:hypothetical protein
VPVWISFVLTPWFINGAELCLLAWFFVSYYSAIFVVLWTMVAVTRSPIVSWNFITCKTFDFSWSFVSTHFLLRQTFTTVYFRYGCKSIPNQPSNEPFVGLLPDCSFCSSTIPIRSNNSRFSVHGTSTVYPLVPTFMVR